MAKIKTVIHMNPHTLMILNLIVGLVSGAVGVLYLREADVPEGYSQ